MTNKIKHVPVLSSDLAEVLFPGNDDNSVLIKSHLTELLQFHVASGRSPTLTSLGQTLSQFVPMAIRNSEVDWEVHGLAIWGRERKQIFEALEDFFLNGGEEERLTVQREMVRGLERAGVSFTGREILLDHLTHAGNWQHKMVDLLANGDGLGIHCSALDTFDGHAAGQILRAAGFSHFLSKHLLTNLKHVTSLAHMEE